MLTFEYKASKTLKIKTMINKILKIIEEHIVLDKDLQKVIKAEYPYKETLSSDIDDLFALHVVSQQRELLEFFVETQASELFKTQTGYKYKPNAIEETIKNFNCG